MTMRLLDQIEYECGCYDVTGYNGEAVHIACAACGPYCDIGDHGPSRETE